MAALVPFSLARLTGLCWIPCLGAKGVLMAFPLFPLTRTVEVFHPVPGTNGFGDPTNSVEYTNPPVRVKVFGWELGGGAEGGPDGHVNRVEWDATLYAPEDASITEDDRVGLPGVGVFSVDGPVGNWNANPYFNSGLVQVRLKRVV